MKETQMQELSKKQILNSQLIKKLYFQMERTILLIEKSRDKGLLKDCMPYINELKNYINSIEGNQHE